MSSARTQFSALFARELRTVVRTRVYLLVALAIWGLVVALVDGGGGGESGYLPAVVDLLLPLELLVPAVAVAVGYRSVVADLERGELAVLESYDVPPWVYVAAIYAGRALALTVVIAGGLVISAILIALSASPDTGIYATHTGVDSPVLFGRFIVLTVIYGLAMLGVVILVSVLARSTRVALALAGGAMVVVVAGGDALVILGLSEEWLAADSLFGALATVPNSAYRGLVFETVVGVASGVDSGYAAARWSALGLVGWLVGSLVLAGGLLGRRQRS